MQGHFEKVIGRLRTLEGLIERLQTVEGGGGGGTGGWTEVSGWSYASATTITVPSGAASIYAVGDQIRLKQGGAYKYFYVIAIADTTLTVTGGSDYSVANAAITDAAFSKGGGVGHPGWFNWSPIFKIGGGNSITVDANDIKQLRFTVNGNKVSFKIDIQTFTITHVLYYFGYIIVGNPVPPKDVNTGARDYHESSVVAHNVFGSYWALYNTTEFKNIGVINSNGIYILAPSDATTRTNNCYLQADGNYEI